MTPWEQKGMVMRTLVEQLGDRELVLVDGVKVPEDDGWALVLPDPEEPVTHVWAEGPSEARRAADGPAVRGAPAPVAPLSSTWPGPPRLPDVR